MKGSLPWQNIKIKDRKEKHKALLKEKSAITLQSLCSGLPLEFAKYLQLVRNLEYDEEPPYDEYIEMFQNLIRNKNIPNIMDWEGKKEVAGTNLVHRIQVHLYVEESGQTVPPQDPECRLTTNRFRRTTPVRVSTKRTSATRAPTSPNRSSR